MDSDYLGFNWYILAVFVNKDEFNLEEREGGAKHIYQKCLQELLF